MELMTPVLVTSLLINLHLLLSFVTVFILPVCLLWPLSITSHYMDHLYGSLSTQNPVQVIRRLDRTWRFWIKNISFLELLVNVYFIIGSISFSIIITHGWPNGFFCYYRLKSFKQIVLFSSPVFFCSHLNWG